MAATGPHRSNAKGKRAKVFVGAAWLVCIAAAASLLWFLGSDRFQDLARVALTSRLEAATGLTCRIDRFHLNVFRGNFSVEGLTLLPKPGTSDGMRVAVEKAAGSFGLPSPWRLRVPLAVLELTRPRIEIAGAQRVSSSSRPGQPSDIVRTSLEFAIGRLTVRQGSIQWQDRTIPFDLSLRDVASEIHYRSFPASYRIRLSYSDSRLVWQGRNLGHRLNASAVLSKDGIEFDSLDIGRGTSAISASGLMSNWQAPRLTLKVTGTVSVGKDLSVFSPIAAESEGNLRFNADLRWDSSGLFAAGRSTSQSVRCRGTTFTDLRGAFAITQTVLSLRDVVAGIGRGTVHAAGDIQLESATTVPDRMEISIDGVALVNVARILKVPEIDVQNSVDARGSVSWLHGDQDLQAAADVDLHAAPEALPGQGTVLQGKFTVRYANQNVDLPLVDLQSPHTTIQWTRVADRRVKLRVSTDLISEPLDLLSRFSSDIRSLKEKSPDLMTASGSYRLAGDVEAETLSPVSYSGEVSIDRGHWRSFSFDHVNAAVSWAGPHIELHSLSARKGPERVQGDLSIDLAARDGESPTVGFVGTLAGISLAGLRDLGVATDYQISGTLGGSGSIHVAHGVWRGEGRIDVENGSCNGEVFDSARGTVRADDRLLRLNDARIRRGTAEVDLNGEIELVGDRPIKVSAQLAALPLSELQALTGKKLDIEGSLAGSGEIRGTVAKPAFSGNVVLDGLRYQTWDLGRGKGTLSFENSAIQGTVAIKSDLGSFEIQGNISMAPGNPGKALLRFENWNARKILVGQIPSFLRDVSTTLQGNVEVQGRFAEPRTITARGQIEGGSFKVQDYELHNSGAIRFTIAESRLRVEQATMVGEGTDLELSGTIPLDGSPALDLGLNGPLNLVILQIPERRIRVSGLARLNVKATGSLQNAQVVGQAALESAKVASPDFPFQLSSLQGNIFFSRDLIRLERVQGNAAAGTLEVSGILEPRNGTLANAELKISVHRARLPYPADFRSIVDAELVLRGSPGSQLLSGEINVIRGEYLRDLNIFGLMAGKGTTTVGPQVTDPLLMGLRLDLAIHSDNGLLVDNALTRLSAGMRLHIRGSPAYPSLTGHIEASEGSIFFRGNKFDIINATADLVDPNRINPVLDVRAEANVGTYQLMLNANGSLDHLNVNVTSDPPLSTADIVSLLATGKSTTPTSGLETSRYQSEVTGVSAASILSESLTGVIGKRVERIFGLQSFRVDPFLAGAENDPTARVTISERLSKDLTVTFSRNLSTSEEQIVMIEYEISRDLSVVATRDELGQFGLDFRFRRRYR